MFQLRRTLAFCLIFTWLAGCANELPGTRAQEIGPKEASDKKPELEVAVDYYDDFSSAYHQAYIVSFVNNSDHWLDVARVDVKFSKVKNPVEYLLGDRLRYYVEGVSRRNEINQYNRDLLMAGIFAAGAVVGASSHNSATQTAGAAAALSSLSVAAANSILSSQQKAEFQKALPDNHLLKPFSIPPGLSMSRWMVITLPDQVFFKEMMLNLDLGERGTRTFTVDDRRYAKYRAKKSEKRLYDRTKVEAPSEDDE